MHLKSAASSSQSVYTPAIIISLLVSLFSPVDLLPVFGASIFFYLVLQAAYLSVSQTTRQPLQLLYCSQPLSLGLSLLCLYCYNFNKYVRILT